MQHPDQAKHDQEDPEQVSCAGGDARGPVQVAAPVPKRGAKDPAAVERERGNQIEQRQDEVDQREIPERADDGGGPVPSDQEAVRSSISSWLRCRSGIRLCGVCRKACTSWSGAT